MTVDLVGTTPGDFIVDKAPYRAHWVTRPAEIVAAEVASAGIVDTSLPTLARKLDEVVGAAGFMRASPLSYDTNEGRISWDLVSNSRAVGLTVAQACTRLTDLVSPLMTLERFEERALIAGEARREADRVAAAAASEASHPDATAAGGWVSNLLGGLKAFGITTAILAALGVGGYLYVTRRKG